MKILQLIVFCCISVLTSCATNSKTTDIKPVPDKFQLIIEADKSEFKIGDPIQINCSVLNNTNEPVIFLVVYNSELKTVTSFNYSIDEEIGEFMFIGEERLHGTEIWSIVKAVKIELVPRSSWSYRFNFDKHITTPGFHKLKVFYKTPDFYIPNINPSDNQFDDELTSNEITIKVTN